jgi:hypothetical protein
LEGAVDYQEVLVGAFREQCWDETPIVQMEVVTELEVEVDAFQLQSILDIGVRRSLGQL